MLDDDEPPERPPPDELPPPKPPDERTVEDDERTVDVLRVVVDVLRTVDVERVDVVDGRAVDVEVRMADEVGVNKCDEALVGRAGIAVVVVLRRCDVAEDAVREVDAPRDVDTAVDVVLLDARRTCAGVDAVARVAEDTLVAKRAVLFTRRRSFSLPRAT